MQFTGKARVVLQLPPSASLSYHPEAKKSRHPNPATRPPKAATPAISCRLVITPVTPSRVPCSTIVPPYPRDFDFASLAYPTTQPKYVQDHIFKGCISRHTSANRHNRRPHA